MGMRISLLLIGLGTCAASAVAEELTLTTYYPSPNLVVQELRTTHNTILADTAGGVAIGTQVLGSGGQPWKLIVAGPGRNPGAGGVCPAGTQHFDEDASGPVPGPGECKPVGLLVTESGRVAIGATNPTRLLEITHWEQANGGKPALQIDDSPNDTSPLIFTRDGNLVVGAETYSAGTPPNSVKSGNLEVNDIWAREANGFTGQWLSKPPAPPTCQLETCSGTDTCSCADPTDFLMTGGGSCSGGLTESRAVLDASGNATAWKTNCNGVQIVCCKFQ